MSIIVSKLSLCYKSMYINISNKCTSIFSEIKYMTW